MKWSKLKEQLKKSDLSEFWQTWSGCVEQGVLRYLGDGMHTDKKNIGRGSVKQLSKNAFANEVRSGQETEEERYKHVRNK